MKEETLHIRNMVCPRCITAVENILNGLKIPFGKVTLGQVFLENEITNEQLEGLDLALNEQGFELLTSSNAKLVSEIKTVIIEQIHHSQEPLKVNFSEYLSQMLGYDYQYLSRLFSSVAGITINRFIVLQKIEKVKELLFYEELSTEKIADRLNYNSVAYLSSVFKKETGMTLTEFRSLKNPNLKGIDKL